jgi:hypothetical protein
MLLPDVHDELVRAAAARTRRRLGARTVSALAAALVATATPPAQVQVRA